MKSYYALSYYKKFLPINLPCPDSAQVISNYTQQWVQERILLQEAYRLQIHRKKRGA